MTFNHDFCSSPSSSSYNWNDKKELKYKADCLEDSTKEILEKFNDSRLWMHLELNLCSWNSQSLSKSEQKLLWTSKLHKANIEASTRELCKLTNLPMYSSLMLNKTKVSAPLDKRFLSLVLASLVLLSSNATINRLKANPRSAKQRCFFRMLNRKSSNEWKTSKSKYS